MIKRVLLLCGSLCVSVSVVIFFTTIMILELPRLLERIDEIGDYSLGYSLWPLAFMLSTFCVGSVVFIYGQRLFNGHFKEVLNLPNAKNKENKEL